MPDQLVKKWFLLFLLLIVAIISYIFFGIYQAVYRPLALSKASHIVWVEQGATLTSVIRNLANEGIVRKPDWLILFAKFNNRTDIRAGEYEIPNGISGQGLLMKLASGEVIQYQVTFIEGSTLSENLSILANQEKLFDDLRGMDDKQFQQLLGLLPSQAEGWIFPDTYAYVRGMKASQVLQKAHKRMRMILDEEWKMKSGNLPYKNSYEALIMASIVEKETGVADERSQIAGVFVRRLKLGMKLQTDPTVIYGLGTKFSGDLSRSHLMEYTPWNTYVIRGLPPTPIACPGRAAINAALNPTPGKALYFVAKGDGTHAFSETLDQHQQAVTEYQLRRKPDYRSAPPASSKLGDGS